MPKRATAVKQSYTRLTGHCFPSPQYKSIICLKKGLLIHFREQLQLAQWPQIIQWVLTTRPRLTTSSSSGGSSWFNSQWPQLFLCLSMFKSCIIANSICALWWPVTIYTDWTFTIIHVRRSQLASIDSATCWLVKCRNRRSETCQLSGWLEMSRQAVWSAAAAAAAAHQPPCDLCLNQSAHHFSEVQPEFVEGIPPNSEWV